VVFRKPEATEVTHNVLVNWSKATIPFALSKLAKLKSLANSWASIVSDHVSPKATATPVKKSESRKLMPLPPLHITCDLRSIFSTRLPCLLV
jgi:hypothetical protein